MCALRGRQPGHLNVRAVLRHFVPYKGLHPLRRCAAILLALHQLKSDLNQKRLSYYAFLENDMVSKFLIMLEMIPLIKKYIQHTIKEE